MPSSSALDTDTLLQLDRTHVWHPYTALHDPLPVYPIVGASGVELELADGRKLIDGMSSWWTAIHGYNVPELNAAAHAQLDRMAHVMFGGITHEPAVALARTLASITPGNLDKVFFCDSGSVAVEVAVKMAVQYQQALGHTDRTALLTIRGGYHGDTFKAMSVCDPVTGMHHLFSGAVQAQYFADRPTCRFGEDWDSTDIVPFQSLLEQHHTTIAAVILEPIVQGAGGMWFYHPEYLREVRALCDHYGVL
ncbi:MAG: aminotransferase class III-fold pyridoxal phosphate-dependent enzyme, partial [Bacteroidota bacterium]